MKSLPPLHLRVCCLPLMTGMLLTFLTSSIANAAEGNVTVKDQGDTVVMENGFVTAVIDKHRAEISSVTLKDARNLLNPRGVSFDAEGFGPGKTQTGLRGGEPEIVTQGPDIAELKFTDRSFVNFLSAEMHFVMRRGVSGVYEYLVMRHGPGQPAGHIGQLRWVLRGEPEILTHAFASAGKQGKMIQPSAFKGAVQIADATFRLDPEKAEKSYPEPLGKTHDGFPVYSKYDWTAYVEDHTAHGFSSQNEGIFMIQPSMEYFNGGPSKGILTVHNGPVSILEFLGGHFLIRDNTTLHLADGEKWEQIIGPWLVYLNKGSDPKELWKDAERQGGEEKVLWPYSWVRELETLYPKARGTVSGTLTLPDGPGSNALIVMASPEKDWQLQTMGYEFWTRADANGRFVIPKVRPGNYSLYASVPGNVGEAKIETVEVPSGRSNDLGTIHWNPPTREKTLWTLGNPDRSTGEFRFGSEPRQFGLWWNYMREKGTNPVTFTIGRSEPSKDWYYAQSAMPMPDGTYYSPVWNICFDIKQPPQKGPMVLTVDLAGACGGKNRLHVKVNGSEVGVIDSPNDSGIYRSAVKSADFRHNILEFDPSLIMAGENTLSLVLETRGNWSKGQVDSVITTDTKGMPELPSSGVMYDCIRLESGPVKGDNSCKPLSAQRQ